MMVLCLFVSLPSFGVSSLSIVPVVCGGSTTNPDRPNRKSNSIRVTEAAAARACVVAAARLQRARPVSKLTATISAFVVSVVAASRARRREREAGTTAVVWLAQRSCLDGGGGGDDQSLKLRLVAFLCFSSPWRQGGNLARSYVIWFFRFLSGLNVCFHTGCVWKHTLRLVSTFNHFNLQSVAELWAGSEVWINNINNWDVFDFNYCQSYHWRAVCNWMWICITAFLLKRLYYYYCYPGYFLILNISASSLRKLEQTLEDHGRVFFVFFFFCSKTCFASTCFLFLFRTSFVFRSLFWFLWDILWKFLVVFSFQKASRVEGFSRSAGSLFHGLIQPTSLNETASPFILLSFHPNVFLWFLILYSFFKKMLIFLLLYHKLFFHLEIETIVLYKQHFFKKNKYWFN